MANITLEAQTPLRGFSEKFGNTNLSENLDTSIFSIGLALDTSKALESISSVLGATWPNTGSSTLNENGTVRLLGLQADQIFVLMQAAPSADGQAAPLPALDESAYVTDQSDSWASLRIDGPNARRALERICPIDLHPSMFSVGAVTRTSMEHLAVIILREDEDSYVLLSPASSALSFLHAIETSLHNIAS